VVFHTLTNAELKSIVDIQLARLANRLADRRLSLEVTDAAKDWLASNGYDPIYGARPLRRLVQSAIGDRLAKALLAGEIRDGDRVLVDLTSDKSGLSVTTG
jgi:ATP-dependent Clp protease ATP-binding subunit ClpB